MTILLNFDAISIAQLIDSLDLYIFIATQSIENHVSIAGLFSSANCSLLNFVALYDEHKRAIVFFHDRCFGYEHTRDRLVVSCGSFVGEEVDARIHLRPQLFVWALDLDLYLDRRLRTVCFGRNLLDEASEAKVRVGFGNDLGSLLRLQAREVSLADVELDL